MIMIMKELSICIENVILYVTDNVRDCLLALVCYWLFLVGV